MGRDEHHPHHPDAAHTDADQHRGQDAVAHRPQGRGQHRDAHIGKEEPHLELHDLRGPVDDPGIVGEQHRQVAAQEIQRAGQGKGDDKAHQQADLHALFHPGHLVCAVVLPDKGGDRHAEGIDDDPEDGVDLAEHRPRGDGAGAEGVDARLDDQVGQGVHHRLQPRGQADVKDAPQKVPVQVDLPGDDLEGAALPVHQPQHQNAAEQLAEDGRQRRSGGGQTQRRHQHKIQQNVAEGAEDQHIQGAFAVAHRPQDAAADIEHQVGDGAQEKDAEIGHGEGHDVLRRGQGAEQPGRGRQAHRHQRHAAHQAQGQGGVYRPAHLSQVASAEVLGDNDGGARGQAHEKADDQVDDGVGGAAHGGKGGGAHKPAHHHGVGGVVKLLQKGAYQDGQEKEQDLLPDHARGHTVNALFTPFCHIYPLSDCKTTISVIFPEIIPLFCGKNRGKCGKLLVITSPGFPGKTAFPWAILTRPAAPCQEERGASAAHIQRSQGKPAVRPPGRLGMTVFIRRNLRSAAPSRPKSRLRRAYVEACL